MIADITISGEGVTIDRTVERYVRKAIGGLDRYLPRAVRKDAQAVVTLRRVDRAHGNKYEAGVTLRAGGRQTTASDSTLNMLAALDIVRVKLVTALQKG